MTEHNRSFVEVCIYEVKPDRTEEFERLVERVAGHHREFPGVTDVRYIKRTHRQGDFASAKRGERPIRLSRKPKSVTYVLYWELEDDVAHGKATQSGLEHFYSDFRKCLIKAPKLILGERLL
ncbi:MAG: hypothetical protein GTO14_09365 [Anaerolineales bacterium]|nr:hypothetical protein [Anaerolineales bacterium]